MVFNERIFGGNSFLLVEFWNEILVLGNGSLGRLAIVVGIIFISVTMMNKRSGIV